MNLRQKKKRKRINSTAKQRERNKALCARYPFLIPRNDFTDEITWNMKWDGRKDKKYSYTLADEFPRGWWKAFGLMLCEELRNDLIKCNYLYKYRIVQIKEKFGALRLYSNGEPIESNAERIISKYSHLSKNICIECGKPDVPIITVGWISPYCYSCYRKQWKRRENWFKNKEGFKPKSEEEIIVTYREITSNNKRMADSYRVISFSENDGDKDTTYDISETANMIRRNSRCRHI